MNEVINFYSDKITNSKIIEKLGLKEENFFVVSAHREENVDNFERLEELILTLNSISKEYKFPIIFSTHPRTQKQLKNISLKPSDNIRFIEPLGFIDYVALQKKSIIVLSDSGTISEESSLLNFRAINIRSSNERPEAMEEASVMMIDINRERILQGIKILLFQNKSKRDYNKVYDYDVSNVSKKVERIIMSYTDYVNKNVWQKKS
jgi:UDP-N-acetylglucosamine 2-epimerase